MKTPSLSQRGAALIVVLSIIILVTILVVGMTLAMRMERSASHFHVERLRAEMLARSGVDRSLAVLNAATATNRFWVSSPGKIVASAPGTFRPLTTNYILSSGFTNSTDSNVVTDLNRKAWNAGDRLLNPGGTNLTVRWIYMLKDGTTTQVLNTNMPNPNPAVGRFAYWVDDDSTRVNVNTAAARVGNQNTLASPSQVSLNTLTNAGNIAAVTNFALTNTFLSALQAVEMDPSLANSRFFLTAHSQTPEVDPWGRPRLVLTTKSEQSTNRPYLNILNSGTADPGFVANIDSGKLQPIFTNVVGSFARNDWPLSGGGSLATQFGAGNILQVGLDIVEYVRTAESSIPWIEPLVVTASTNSLTVVPPGTALDAIPPSALIGNVRRPLLTQVSVFTGTAAGGHEATLRAQFYLPDGFKGNAATLTNLYLHTEIQPDPGSMAVTNRVPVTLSFNSEGYAECTISPTAVTFTGPPTRNLVRVALLKDNSSTINNILDIAPLEMAKIPVPAGEEQTGSAWVNDPRRNKVAGNWTGLPLRMGNVPLETNSWTFPAYPNSDGTNTSASFPRENTFVGSVGELGYIFTGEPWRSVRLRPGSVANTNQLPDWAILELFAAPFVNPSGRISSYAPGTNVVAGRVNVNALISLADTNWSRSQSVSTLFTNTSMSAAVGVVVSNVMGATNLTGGGLNFSGTNAILLSVGQLAEISGVMTNNTETAEISMRQLASLATVRSGVFTVYSMGQALQVSLGGKVTINGEKMIKATVERYFDSTGEAKFRTIAWSEIYP